MLAGLLYLGSGLGLGGYIIVRSLSGARRKQFPPLGRSDLPWLAGAVVCGGILAPLLLMWGLMRTPASTTSLLLNLEGVLTVLLAWWIFRENIGIRFMTGLAAIIAGAVLLSISPESGGGGGLLGRIAIVAACLAWAVDNNLTRRISAGDPAVIAGIKGLAAGGMNVTIALMMGQAVPRISLTALAGLVGFIGYGASLVLFVLALRNMGAARTGALFSTAPFIGAVCALLFLGEQVNLLLIPAAVLMGIGVWLQLGEKHHHEHIHQATTHLHTHEHDEHHQHDHDGTEPEAGKHNHPHQHVPLVHAHRHYPDIHHRHDHE